MQLHFFDEKVGDVTMRAAEATDHDESESIDVNDTSGSESIDVIDENNGGDQVRDATGG